MTVELSTATGQSPMEVLDLQVTSRRTSGKSVLSLRFICNNNIDTNHMQIPTLSWFDVSQMQLFSQKLATAHYPEICQVDLLDAGLRLTGSVRQLAGRWTTGRTIRIEPLPSAKKQFEPFTIYASSLDVKTYAGKLYTRLWELFTKG